MAIFRILNFKGDIKNFLVGLIFLHNLKNDLFFHVMNVIVKSAKMSNKTVFINKMAGIESYKTTIFGGETANFAHDTAGIS